MKILAIDPGPKESAWLIYDFLAQRIDTWAKVPNQQLLDGLGAGPPADVLVVEKVEAFGMAVGAEVFETVWWSGRFHQAWEELGRRPAERVGRKAVKIHLCGSMRAKDPNIRAALLDRFGGDQAKGTKASPGPLFGLAGDGWSALAVAVTWADQHP